jgi:hypothetical protein
MRGGGRQLTHSNQTTHVEPETAYDAIGESILSDALTRARGRHQPYCIGEQPKRAYYVSNLAPTHGETNRETFVSQVRPSNITLEFKPADPETTLEHVEFEFDVYIPSFPTYDEYLDIRNRSVRAAVIDHRRAIGNAATEAGDVNVNEPPEPVDVPSNAVTIEDALANVDDIEVEDISGDLYALNQRFFRRVTVETTTTIDITDDNASRIATRDVLNALEDELRNALSEDDIIATRASVSPDPAEFDGLDFTQLTEDEHTRVRRSLPTLSPGNETLEWNVRVEVEVRDNTGETEVVLRLANCPKQSPGKEQDEEAESVESPAEPHILNPRIGVEATLNPYQFELLPEDYRFEQHIWAKGRNCSTTGDALDAENEAVRRIETTSTPTSPVYEFEFNTDYNTRFAALAGDVSGVDTLDVLRDIERGMREYHGEWLNERRDDFVDEYGDPSPELDEYEAAAETFDAEREEFREAIGMLEDRPEVLRAFQMMNRVNHRLHSEMTPPGEGFESWRLFQLVFIVKNLPSIVARDPNPEYEQYADTERDERAEVLWFPTGGGKTEAYLGLVVFNLFFDRIRGKHRGVTAWIRFPLRLLSRQQKQRFMEAMLVAEQYRLKPESEGGLDGAGDEFALGYFPGSQDSPNDIGKNNNLDEAYAGANEPGNTRAKEKLESDCKHLDSCPLCGSDVDVEYNETDNSVYHFCTGNELDDGEECIDRLPFYVVDHDIYRYLPSVLLGSLDKVAVMGMNPLFANLFGNFTTRCPIHGLGYSDNCPENHICEHGPASSELEDVEPGTRDPARRDDVRYFDPIPSLHLVDEVHLLNEELGTMASHYESTFLTLCKKISEERNDDGEVAVEGITPKVLTSTATIEKFERQIEMLFQKDAARFPEEGPKLMETFYGKLNKQRVEREYRGITPNSRSHLYAILDFIKQYHELVRDYYVMDSDDIVRHVVKGFHLRNPDNRPSLDPNDTDDLDTLVAEAESGWADGFDESERDSVLDRYETSLLYFTNIQEKDTYRQNISQIDNEMRHDGYDIPIESAQLTGDTRDTDTLPRLERDGKFADEPFHRRIDTVPATSFVGHGIDVDRFNFMLFYGYPSQTFQYIQASSRVGRKDNIPGFVMDVFRPFDKRDRHRYKYFEKLHEYLNRTVEPVPIDRWAKFAVEKTFSGVMMALLLQYYRPLLFREGEEPDVEGSSYTRVNIQSGSHMFAVMDDDDKYPQLTKETIREDLHRAYALSETPYYLSYKPNDGNGFYVNEFFRTRVDRRLNLIWNDWRHKLRGGEMGSPQFPEKFAPMKSLRHIEEEVEITSFSNNIPIIEALENA